MAEEAEVGCARPTGGQVGEPVEEAAEEKSKPDKSFILVFT